MVYLTIAIDDETLRRARIRALELDTSVNALLRDYLQAFAGDDRMFARHRIVEGADVNAQRLGFGDRTWTRDDLHERQ